MLTNALVKTAIYAPEAGKLLFISQTADSLEASKAFALSQLETDYVEVNGDRLYPDGRVITKSDEL